jgi:hypothetical protein
MNARTPGPWKRVRPLRSTGVVRIDGHNTDGAVAWVCAEDVGRDAQSASDNADFIVEACNAHDSLIAQRDALAKALREIVTMTETVGIENKPFKARNIARAALAAPKEGA